MSVPSSLRRLVPLGALVSCSIALGQTPIYTLHAKSYSPSSKQFGKGVAIPGDLNGDGYPDLAVGYGNPGQVRAISGKDTSLLQNWFFGNGVAVSGAGDHDNDGVPDVLLGDPFAGADGYAWVVSGADGHLIVGYDASDYTQTSSSFGQEVSELGDIDGDAYDDVLIGNPNDDNGSPGGQGSVRALSGKTHQVLHEWWGTEPVTSQRFGWSLDSLADVDADGCPDVLIGAFYGAYAKCYSGASGALLHDLQADVQSMPTFGRRVSSAGDVDADGYDDFLIGEYGGGALLQGRAHVYSGATGTLIRTLEGDDANGYFGWSFAALGDVDNDGLSDFAIGTNRAAFAPYSVEPSYVRVYSGASLQQMFMLEGKTPTAPAPDLNDEFGSILAGGADFNLDGTPDLVVGAYADSTYSGLGGLVRVYSCKPLALSTDIHQVSVSAGGTQTLRLNAGSANSNKLYLLIGTTSGVQPGVSVGSLLVPLNVDSYSTYTLANPNHAPLSQSLGVLGSDGKALAGFSLPLGTASSLAGLTAHHAYVVLSGLDVAFASNAASVSLIP